MAGVRAGEAAIGRKFGRLTVVGIAGRTPQYGWRMNTVCECGTAKVIELDPMKRGSIRSCGCLHSETAANLKRKHGMWASHADGYYSWTNIIARCLRPSTRAFKYYGGRGITVCDRWRTFAGFFADMGPRPAHGYTIDRINPDGNYEPGNCRWATWKEQASNKRPKGN